MRVWWKLMLGLFWNNISLLQVYWAENCTYQGKQLIFMTVYLLFSSLKCRKTSICEMNIPLQLHGEHSSALIYQQCFNFHIQYSSHRLTKFFLTLATTNHFLYSALPTCLPSFFSYSSKLLINASIRSTVNHICLYSVTGTKPRLQIEAIFKKKLKLFHP